ncbi:uncharacterized protein LOC132268789 [Cornus florida]|uniref:uncharacterized protein LOC132268789 n=1 Tax=Cornus florida TaxID=4283 RepID=UPI002896B7F1|nr:uncharacterized protein LOC132268789 [Cornus florida]
MQKKRSDGGHHRSTAWNLLRLALLWARKGGVFKSKFLMELRLLPRYLKTTLLRHSGERGTNTNAIHYGEREFSFDDTPIIHSKLRRPASLRFHIPCITNPQVDFDYDFNDDNEDDDSAYYYNDGGARKSSLNNEGGDEIQDDDHHYGCAEDHQMVPPYDEEGIDLKAEEFIAKFYQQMKLQRQISYLQYHDMLNRGAS